MTKKEPLLITPALQTKMLKDLMAAKIALNNAQRRVDDAVAMGRASDLEGHCALSWQEIGQALGVTKQAAMAKYANRLL